MRAARSGSVPASAGAWGARRSALDKDGRSASARAAPAPQGSVALLQICLSGILLLRYYLGLALARAGFFYVDGWMDGWIQDCIRWGCLRRLDLQCVSDLTAPTSLSLLIGSVRLGAIG